MSSDEILKHLAWLGTHARFVVRTGREDASAQQDLDAFVEAFKEAPGPNAIALALQLSKRFCGLATGLRLGTNKVDLSKNPPLLKNEFWAALPDAEKTQLLTMLKKAAEEIIEKSKNQQS